MGGRAVAADLALSHSMPLQREATFPAATAEFQEDVEVRHVLRVPCRLGFEAASSWRRRPCQPENENRRACQRTCSAYYVCRLRLVARCLRASERDNAP